MLDYKEQDTDQDQDIPQDLQELLEQDTQLVLNQEHTVQDQLEVKLTALVWEVQDNLEQDRT